MAVRIWAPGEFSKEKLVEYAEKEIENDVARGEWIRAVRDLGVRAFSRGDGLAIYVNNDLGHPDIGQWQIMSFGSEDSQLETRQVDTTTKREYLRGTYIYGNDLLPMTLPDIGGRINWRYQLEAIVPCAEQHVAFGDKTLQVGERLVVLQFKVTGETTPEQALALAQRVVSTALEQWHDTGGTHGFADDDLGPELHEAGVGIELIDSAVI